MRLQASQRRFKTYLPRPRQVMFHQVPAVGSKLIKGAIGGWGGGKSTACENELIELALRMPGGHFYACRKSMSGRAELSVLSDLKRMLHPTGVARWVASAEHFQFTNGARIYVGGADDHEKFGSIDLCGWFIQEAQEVKQTVFDALSARLRHPAGYIDGRPYYRGLFDARGVKRAHWINRHFIEKAWDVDTSADLRPKVANPNFVYVKFTSWDNKENLPPGYIEELIREHEGDLPWLKVFIEGEIGFDVEGRPVFGTSFDPEKHIAHVEEDPALPMLRGWDFGYRAPGVLWAQYTRSGRLLFLRELAPKNVSTDTLIEQAVALQKEAFPTRHPSTYLDFGDAQGVEMQSSSDYQDIQKIEDALQTSVQTRKVSIETGLNVLRNLMVKTTKVGKSLVHRFAVDPSCETFVDALSGSYFYPEDKEDKPPVKGGSYAAVCDAARYIAQLIVEEGVVRERDTWSSQPVAGPEPSGYASYRAPANRFW